MEEMYRTHKEPAWGWIGALLDARQSAAPAAPATAKLAAASTPKLRPGRAAC
ncbi:hypothetical protein D3C72_1180930 [compost metagenome]